MVPRSSLLKPLFSAQANGTKKFTASAPFQCSSKWNQEVHCFSPFSVLKQMEPRSSLLQPLFSAQVQIFADRIGLALRIVFEVFGFAGCIMVVVVVGSIIHRFSFAVLLEMGEAERRGGGGERDASLSCPVLPIILFFLFFGWLPH